MCAIITCSSSEKALDYKRRIFGPQKKNFLKLHIIYNGLATVCKTLLGLFHRSLHLPAPLDYQFKLNAAFGHWPLNV